MASEVAHPELVNNTHASDAPLTNGDGDHVMTDSNAGNTEAFTENAALSKMNSMANTAADAPVANGSTPIENVTSGIAPVADFILKDPPTSHPTPPPDEPLITPEANIDTVMTSVDDQSAPEPVASASGSIAVQPVADAAQPSTITSNESKSDAEAQPAPTSSDSSLVRPRDEDDDGEDEERAAKRSRVEEDSALATGIEQQTATDGANAQPSPRPADEVVAKIENEDDAKPAESSAVESTAPVTNGEHVSEAKPKPVSSGELQPTAVAARPVETPAAPQSLASASTPKYSTTPLTPVQMRFLQEKMKNLKKTKNSLAFLQPVDPVALNIPTYPEIVKEPMDLGTMEQKLKAGQYKCVQDFASDFNLIIHNTRTFNGPDHAVTQAGMAMDAYFRKMMETVPSADQPAARPQPKKASPKPPAPARRESRSATNVPTAQPTPTTNPAPSETFALQADGTPQIRRESTTNRPARTIKAPPPRELAYAKPKRKEHQMELKFAEDVLTKIRGPKYGNYNNVFLAPVDPVALNIPHYRQIVKHPMDLGTMAQKLKNGQYSRASEVKKDFDLMISNCLAFNPNGNPVRDMGIQLQREFEALWRDKEKWEKKHRQARAASASADEDSADEDEEEEEEENPQDPASTIRALQKQLADMQNALAGLGQGPKQKKAKTAKASSKKSGGTIAVSKAKAAAVKAKPKKSKLVTYEEKQEISEAVGKMNGAQVERLTNIITSNCSKYAEQEEMELEIDDLPNHVQAMLLTFVREQFGGPTKKARAVTPDDGAGADDDDFEPSERRGAKSGKRKKHKPMGKQEQQAAINQLQKQLAQFQGGGSDSASPTNSGHAAGGHDADTSGDESEESEEE